jgi:hypothetical protein
MSDDGAILKLPKLSLVDELACVIDALATTFRDGLAAKVDNPEGYAAAVTMGAREFIALLARRAPSRMTHDELVPLMTLAREQVEAANANLGIETVEDAASKAARAATREWAMERLFPALVHELKAG